MQRRDANGRPTRLYRIWMSMRSRCSCPTAGSYRYYGGRGIAVEAVWDDYSVFAAWAVANSYGDTLSIDRIDPDGNYCPENCRWVTPVMNSGGARQTYGESHWKSKVTKEQVLEIRKLQGVRTQKQLANEFGISQSHVCRIQSEQYWPAEAMA